MTTETKMVLGVTTCDKCGAPMKKGQNIVIIGLSTVANANSELEVPGAGDAITRKITELVTTDKLDYYQKLKSEFPERKL